MNEPEFIILQGGLICGLYNAEKSKRGGVLIPVDATIPAVKFLKRRDARRAVSRTLRVAEMLQGNLVDDWLRLSPLLTGQPYTIIPLVSSHS